MSISTTYLSTSKFNIHSDYVFSRLYFLPKSDIYVSYISLLLKLSEAK